MKRYITILILLTLVLIACGKPEPIVIGFSAGMSGERSALGISLRNSFMLKVEEINGSGGINGRLIEVMVKDDENDLEKVSEVDRFFIDEGVDLIFGHDYSFKAEAILEATKDQDMIVFSSTMSTSTIAGLDDNFFRTSPTANLQGKAIADYMNDKTSKGIVLCDESQVALVESIIEGYSDNFMGTFDVWQGPSPFSESIAEISALVMGGDYDHVVFIASPEDTMLVSGLLDVQDFSGYLISASWAMNTTSDSDLNYPEGLIFVADDDLTTEAYEAYLIAYENKYNEKPGNAAINAYEGATVLFEGLRQAEEISFEGIKRSLLKMDYVTTATGRTRFDAYGDAVKVMYYYGVVEGEIIKLDEEAKE